MKLHQTDYCQITSLCHVKDLIWMLRHFNVLRTKTWKMKENISIVLNLVACKLPLFYISRCSFTENLLHFVKFQDSTIKSCTFCNYFILNCWRARIKFYTNCLFVNERWDFSKFLLCFLRKNITKICLSFRDEILDIFCQMSKLWKNFIIKVIRFQNDFMKSSFLLKYERKIVRISAQCKGQIISKANYLVLNSSKKWTRNFCPSN